MSAAGWIVTVGVAWMCTVTFICAWFHAAAVARDDQDQATAEHSDDRPRSLP